MECFIHPSMNYLDVRAIVQKQREYIHSRIMEVIITPSTLSITYSFITQDPNPPSHPLLPHYAGLNSPSSYLFMRVCVLSVGQEPGGVPGPGLLPERQAPGHPPRHPRHQGGRLDTGTARARLTGRKHVQGLEVKGHSVRQARGGCACTSTKAKHAWSLLPHVLTYEPWAHWPANSPPPLSLI